MQSPVLGVAEGPMAGWFPGPGYSLYLRKRCISPSRLIRLSCFVVPVGWLLGPNVDVSGARMRRMRFIVMVNPAVISLCIGGKGNSHPHVPMVCGPVM